MFCYTSNYYDSSTIRIEDNDFDRVASVAYKDFLPAIQSECLSANNITDTGLLKIYCSIYSLWGVAVQINGLQMTNRYMRKSRFVRQKEISGLQFQGKICMSTFQTVLINYQQHFIIKEY